MQSNNLKKPKDIDEYIAATPKELQERLRQIRQIVRETTPDAIEKISYGIPAYMFHGRLIYFAAFKNHIGFYPMKDVIQKFEKELSGYHTSKGTIQFPHNKPLPLTLIKKIIKFRMQENLSKLKK